ncbi:ModD protein [Hydrogenibacillus schlegelii]|uniref:Putative pyrophosphorylase ModD n=1 Tax=Hydrogenibacillus schlegelii TaxID=1484 RepID=A0A132N8B7_HYDSH|nr:ModD protein [Hydrogenibacillus schlegelii]KWX06359.1 hypothetical protein TR75_06175 [Hydrogenibacillus schlegelii]OAR04050.1 hypothetical protein SA87_10605 [Hydrogenibacillus schlegelii]
MSVFIPRSELEKWLLEDVPSLDLTVELLGLKGKRGRLRFVARQACIICSTEEVERLAGLCGVAVEQAVPSGTKVNEGKVILTLRGSSEELHRIWKVGANLLEYYSGVATRTSELVSKAKAVNPNAEILATRKHIPGTKALAVKAVRAGGGWPHRLGLSETVLIFEQHRVFLSNEEIRHQLQALKTVAVEKKIFLEVATLEEARAFLAAGAHGVQFDKVRPEVLGEYVGRLKAEFPAGLVLAAGGIRAENVAAFAATGVDGLVTSSMDHGPPLDIGAKMEPA